MGPDTTSRNAAASRTVRVMPPYTTSPLHESPLSGPSEIRPRDDFNPTSPHVDAGIRIEPPPSPPWPSGTMRDATAAAVPPLDPPGDRSRFHGLRVGPYASGSVDGRSPSSGQFV